MGNRGIFRFFAAVILVGAPPCPADAQHILPRPDPEGIYRIVEKHNFRKRVDGAYIGAAYREVRGVLRRAGHSAGSGGVYEGRFYVLEETMRAARPAAARIDESVRVRLTLGPAGAVVSGSPGRFPTMRDFPALPEEPVEPGAAWQASAERILDPDFSGAATPVRVFVDYRYTGPGTYRGFPGHNLTAKYAVRHRGGGNSPGDPDLEEATGTHDVTIFLPSGEGPRVISETFREQYLYAGGRNVRLEGTILTFFEGVAPLDRPGTAADVAARIAGRDPSVSAAVQPGTPPPAIPEPGSVGPPASIPGPALPAGPESPEAPRSPPDIEVGSRPEGVALTINNLRFKPDSAELLPGEAGRLDALAHALAAVPDRTLLVVGHTADIGRPEGQKKLSVDRARAVADALEKRGIPRDRLLYEGRGGTEPAAANSTEEGRARNRRVEIIILED